MDLDGSSSEYAVLRASGLTVQSTIEVDKLVRIDASFATSPNAAVNLPDADDRLELGTTRSQGISYNGGAIQGSGTLVQNGDASVRLSGSQLFEVGTFDWDGSTGSSTTVGFASFLHLDVSELADTMDGDVSLNAGHLRVSTLAPWRMRGAMTFDGATSVLDGSDIVLEPAGEFDFRTGIDLQGSVNASGVANLLGTTTFRSTSTTEVAAGSTLVLWGETHSDGGLIDASGTIQQAGDAFVTADQTISTTSVFDWDGPLTDSSFTVENGREFHLTAGSLNPSHNVYNGYLSIHGGLLNVDVADDQWFLADTLRLISGVKGEGAAIMGDDLDVTGGVVATGP